jgi:hypothetical protein
MQRRELIKQMAAALTVLSTSTAFADAVTNYSDGGSSSTLDEDQLALLAQLVDVIIPVTDTPGASAAGVHKFIAYMLEHYYDQDQNHAFQSGLLALEQSAQGHFNTSLSAADPDQKLTLFNALERQRKISAERDFVVWLKELTVMGYYTSEIGATEELRFLAIPGTYSACIDFSEVGRTWAT